MKKRVIIRHFVDVSVDTSFKQSLKAKAHSLKPTILFGIKGLTDSLVEETNQALLAHELIKIKLSGIEKAERKPTADKLCQRTQAELVQLIGSVAIIYRKNEK